MTKSCGCLQSEVASDILKEITSSAKGENHPNWKGGITPENARIRKSKEYANWRKEVFKRDDYTCQCCSQKGGKLNAHHIENFADNEDLRVDIDNGITLCEKCHIEFHSTYGRKNNNKQQIDDFIKNKNDITISLSNQLLY